MHYITLHYITLHYISLTFHFHFISLHNRHRHRHGHIIHIHIHNIHDILDVPPTEFGTATGNRSKGRGKGNRSELSQRGAVFSAAGDVGLAQMMRKPMP